MTDNSNTTFDDLDLLRRSAEALRADPAVLAIRVSREHILSIHTHVQHLQDRVKRLQEEMEDKAAKMPAGIANSGRAVIEDGSLVIRVAVDALPQVVEGSWAAGYMDTRFKVTDAAAFARGLVYALNDESEDGTTPIHRLFDKCIEEAINQGTEGIEEHENQEA